MHYPRGFPERVRVREIRFFCIHSQRQTGHASENRNISKGNRPPGYCPCKRGRGFLPRFHRLSAIREERGARGWQCDQQRGGASSSGCVERCVKQGRAGRHTVGKPLEIHKPEREVPAHGEHEGVSHSGRDESGNGGTLPARGRETGVPVLLLYRASPW